MESLFTYVQEKKDNKWFIGSTTLNVFESEENIIFSSVYYFENKNKIYRRITHKLDLNFINGDFIILYILETNNKTVKKTNPNDFKLLFHLIEVGMILGEHTKTYWGAQYKKAIDKISTIFYNKLKTKFKDNFYCKSLLNHKSEYRLLYRLIVNYHLDNNDIKSHNGIYHTIYDNYPSKKWLLKNNNNFLPAILDSYGIKCNYFIKEININTDVKIDLKVLKYVCGLFGSKYIDYIKQIDWKWCCGQNIYFKKKHYLENDHEKKLMVKIINNMKEIHVSGMKAIQKINNFLTNLEEIKKIDPNIKFKYNNIDSFEKTFDKLQGILRHKKRGYRIKYTLPDDFVNMVQEKFIINDIVYSPKILLTEEDFIIEGHQMNNCMSTQFSHGIIFIYISLKSNNGVVNLQYKRGKLIQGRGKNNINITGDFKPGINVLNERLILNPDIKWTKEKFDLI